MRILTCSHVHQWVQISCVYRRLRFRIIPSKKLLGGFLSGQIPMEQGDSKDTLGGGVQGKTLGSKKVCCTNRGAPRALRLLVWKWLARTSLLPHCAVR